MLFIEWNGLYSAQPAQQAFAARRIESFYWRHALILRGVHIAECTYVYFSLSFRLCTDMRSNTGWHGPNGGHITVHFLRADWSHVTTRHVGRRG